MIFFSDTFAKQTIYELIPSGGRIHLHKMIGENLLESTAINPLTNYLLGLAQINIYCKEGALNSQECSRFATSNAMGAKIAIRASNFAKCEISQAIYIFSPLFVLPSKLETPIKISSVLTLSYSVLACQYIDMGMQLLQTRKWETQYSLCLDLYEMAASVAAMHGEKAKMSAYLDEILSHVRVFNDSLKALSLLVKLLVSSSRFEEARSKCLMVLSALGEEFPLEVDLPLVHNELSLMKSLLKHITTDQLKSLPPMTDKNKLNAMSFMNLLCICSDISKVRLSA